MFINYSNHPSDLWAEEQRSAAAEYGELVDEQFPRVPTELSAKEVERLAEAETERILAKLEHAKGTHAVMCQGEFSLTYAVVTLLRRRAAHVKVVCAVSDRVTRERYAEGKTIKEAEYEFRGFREYM